MRIFRSTISTENSFCDFWTAALAYQQSRQLPLWPSYPEAKIKDEIRAGLHFSACAPDGVLLGYFSLALSDALIWENKEQGDAIYIIACVLTRLAKGIILLSRFSHGRMDTLPVSVENL